MKKYTFLFVVLLASMNTVFSQLHTGTPFETWSASLNFDQYNDDHIITFGYSDFETWSNSKRFIHFFDENIIESVPDIKTDIPDLNNDIQDTNKYFEVFNQTNNLTKEVQATLEENTSSASQKINIFPNPVVDKLNVCLILNSFSDIEISLFNSIGKVVYNSLTKDKKQFSKMIDVENLNRGIYFLEVKTIFGKTIKKVIVK